MERYAELEAIAPADLITRREMPAVEAAAALDLLAAVDPPAGVRS
ncbi:hypothetical protein [Actinomadura rudentiformis]|nr:hypothetical protein [Actinomadura rudentiformis]